MKSFLLFFIFLIVQSNFAQSFVSASEKVSIKIVDGISITVREKAGLKNTNKYQTKRQKNKRGLLVSYQGVPDSLQKIFSSLRLSTHSTNSILIIGKQTEIKHLNKNDYLHIDIIAPKGFEELNANHFVTVVF